MVEETFLLTEDETVPLVIKTNPLVLLELKLKSLSKEEDLIFDIEINSLKRWLNENIEKNSEAKKIGDQLIETLNQKDSTRWRETINTFIGNIRRGKI